MPNYYLIVPNSGHPTPIFKHGQFNKLMSDFFKEPYRKVDKLERLIKVFKAELLIK